MATWLGGLLAPIVAYLTGLIRYAIESLISDITDAIDKVRYDLNYAKNKAIDFLTAAWGSEVGFWAIVAGVLAIAVLAPYAVAAVKSLLAVPSIAKVITEVENISKLILGDTGVAEISLLNKIAIDLSPSYRALWADFHAALSALAGDMKIGVGVLSDVMITARSIVNQTYAFLGVTPDASNMIFDNQFSTFTKNVHDKLAEYETYPDHIWNDIESAVITPIINDNFQKYSNLGAVVVTINDLAQRTSGYVDGIIADFNDLKDKLPDELQKVYQKALDDSINKIADFKKTYIDPVLNDISSTISTITADLQRMRFAIFVSNAYVSSPADLLAQIFTFTQAERDNQAMTVYSIHDLALRLIAEQSSDSVVSVVSDIETSKPSVPEQYTTVAPAQPPAQSLLQPTTPITHKEYDWYVGDY